MSEAPKSPDDIQVNTTKNTGIKRVFKAMFYSYKGFTAAFRSEAAFRQELTFALILLPVALWLDVEKTEQILLVATLFLVLITELLNSAIEAVVDRVSLEKHELAGRAKDMGSAAVLLSLILWAYVWGVIVFL